MEQGLGALLFPVKSKEVDRASHPALGVQALWPWGSKLGFAALRFLTFIIILAIAVAAWPAFGGGSELVRSAGAKAEWGCMEGHVA